MCISDSFGFYLLVTYHFLDKSIFWLPRLGPLLVVTFQPCPSFGGYFWVLPPLGCYFLPASSFWWPLLGPPLGYIPLSSQVHLLVATFWSTLRCHFPAMSCFCSPLFGSYPSWLLLSTRVHHSMVTSGSISFSHTTF